MNESKYFLISMGEDGLEVEEISDIADFLKDIAGNETIGFHSSIPDTKFEWGEKSLIIKGQIVTPRPIKIVTEYDID